MPRFSVNGLDLAYEDHGSGAPLVLVHGFTGTQGDWMDQVGWLAEGHRVVTYDHRGHGDSDRADRYTLDLLTDDLFGVLDTLGLDDVVLMGHSMGGMVVQKALLRSPERVKAMVLVSTVPGSFPMPARQLARVDKLGGLAVRLGMQAMVDLQRMQGPLYNPAHQDLMANRDGYETFFAEKQLATDPQAYAQLLRELVDQEDRLTELARLDHATLVVIGSNDRRFQDGSQAIVETMPNAQLAWIEGAGHHPQFEAPYLFDPMLRDFLAAVSCTRPEAPAPLT